MSNRHELTERVKKLLLSRACDKVGITPIERLTEAPEGNRPKDILPTARNVVVGAVRIIDTVCDDLPYSRYEYTSQFFTLNARLNLAATELCRFLEGKGYRNVPIPAAYPRVNKEIKGVLSHRHAAVAAGVGEFGLNNLLITEEFGPRVRLISIITEAELKPDEPCKTNLCEQRRDECELACVRSCPVDALNTEGHIDKHTCLHYQEHIMPWSATELRCGLCLARCPIGKREFKIEVKVGRSEEVKGKKALWTGAKW